ncbi:GNAT family N-acetyltransferase [Lactococcus nasutitermitis]|uniref:GNAT family N-acetyltransferase n=1 Tax=Lactococcus nasutitermitis TaxID=1652957 RepID=A0ABV9JD33_9LACT|nr:GNAT family N-acetyltransferase [Lactococcus nasutitermitis]
MEFRLANVGDAAAVLAIYRPYVEKTAITFEYDVPTVADFAERIEKISADFPYIVALENGKILAYAYASRYRERKAYDWVVELSIYVDETCQHKGIGRILYQKLLTALSKLNYQRAYACITYPNEQSVKFHTALGFHWIGVFEKSGYKFDNWYGISWMDIALQKTDEVQAIRSVKELTADEISQLLN